MFESIIAGVVLMAVSGIGYLAYKYPNGYRKLYMPLLVITGIIALSIVVWNGGIIVLSSKLHDILSDSQFEQVENIANSLRLSTSWTIIINLAICLYLGFLLYLPILLKDDPKE